MRHSKTLITIALAAALAGGCATEQQTQTAVGTGAGAVAGAVLGTAIGGTGRGTAIGAAVGAGVGAAAGYNWQTIKEKLGFATKGSNLQVAEQQDGSVKVNMPGAVSFASGSAALNPALHGTLDKVAGTLNEYPATTITVVGHTDSVGDEQMNLDLSRRRAAAVADYLSQRGIDRNRMIVEGRGKAEPIADNSTEAGRAQNRRVEMHIQPAAS